MSQKYFPIKTETACQLKWNWSTIRLYNGTTSSCHRVNSDKISYENFHEFHNTSKKISDRTLMLNGQWPSGGCEYCRKIEEAGGSSDRLMHLTIPDQTPIELEYNQTAIHVTPKILEIYFDNVCNMSCLYCWDGFSSKLQQENIKFGRFEDGGVIIDNVACKSPEFDKLTDALWHWLDLNHRALKRFHVLGGEPFYQSQFDKCLDFFDSHPSPELELNVISNLKVSLPKLKSYIGQIKHLIDNKKISRFDLTASIDCFGDEQEYVRYGINLDQWRENFEYLVEQPWITLNINQTLSGLTIKTVPELIRYINKLKAHREIGHYFSTVVMTYDFLHPGIFGGEFFVNDFDLILKEMHTNTWQEKHALNYMNGIKLQIESCNREPEKIKQLGIFLDEMDRRRGLNWRETFPWLEQELNNVV